VGGSLPALVPIVRLMRPCHIRSIRRRNGLVKFRCSMQSAGRPFILLPYESDLYTGRPELYWPFHWLDFDCLFLKIKNFTADIGLWYKLISHENDQSATVY